MPSFVTPVDPHAPILEPWLKLLEAGGSETAILDAANTPLRTFGEIEAEAQKFAEGIEGVPARSVVAVRIGNSASWPAVLLALLRTNLVTLPLGDGAQAPEFAAALVDEGLRWQQNPAYTPGPELPPEIALLKMTSGTTGAPRAIAFTAAQLAADCRNICATMGIAPGDINYGAIPFAHSYGFSNLILPLLLDGVRLDAK